MNQEPVLLEWSPGPLLFSLFTSLEFRIWLLIEDVTVPGLPQREAGVADSARQGWGCSWRRIVSWRWNRARIRVPLPWVTDYCLESRSFNMHVIFQTVDIWLSSQRAVAHLGPALLTAALGWGGAAPFLPPPPTCQSYHRTCESLGCPVFHSVFIFLAGSFSE